MWDTLHTHCYVIIRTHWKITFVCVKFLFLYLVPCAMQAPARQPRLGHQTRLVTLAKEIEDSGTAWRVEKKKSQTFLNYFYLCQFFLSSDLQGLKEKKPFDVLVSRSHCDLLHTTNTYMHLYSLKAHTYPSAENQR